MGREWLYKSSRGGDGGGGKSPSTAKRVNEKTKKENERNNFTSSSGCMSAIFNLFDIQDHHRFRFNHPAFISESTIIDHQESNSVLQGVEAPRNSLESPEPDTSVFRLSSKQETNLNIQMGGIKIKTQRTRITEDVSSECSPGTKTPSLVARLMGLDLLPEYSSPRPSSSSTPATSHHRSRSLPSTPRASTGSRRSSENKDYHHRLSLQVDKENGSSCRGHEHESLQMKMARRGSELLDPNDEDGSSQYAKEIANQVRERISRRLGTDITNTISLSAGKNKEQRRDSNLILLKPKPKKPFASTLEPSPTHVLVQAPVMSTKAKQNDSKHFPHSQKVTLFDIKNNINKPTTKSKPMKDEKLKRISSEKYDLRLKKSTLLSSNGVKKVKNKTKFVSFKKELTSSSSTTKLPQKQVSLVKLPSTLNSPYKANDINVSPLSVTKGVSFPDNNEHFDYISRILNHCGIYTTTPISCGQWYSPSNPLHPSIFNQLEKPHRSTAMADAGARRRMIFDFVNELLVEIVKPYVNPKPWIWSRQCNTLENVILPDSFTMCGSDLIKKLCKKIGSFPTADCESLEDIDRLIETDMRHSVSWLTAFATEEIVKEVENEIVETLIQEMATAITDRK